MRQLYNNAVHRQKAVTADFTSEQLPAYWKSQQLLPFDFT